MVVCRGTQLLAAEFVPNRNEMMRVDCCAVRHIVGGDGCNKITGGAVRKVHAHVEESTGEIGKRRVVGWNGYQVSDYRASYAESRKKA